MKYTLSMRLEGVNIEYRFVERGREFERRYVDKGVVDPYLSNWHLISGEYVNTAAELYPQFRDWLEQLGLDSD